MFGGRPTLDPPLTDTLAGSAGGQAPLSNTVWTFDAAKREWSTVENKAVGEQPIGYAATAYDPATSRGWVFAGIYERVGYYTYPSTYSNLYPEHLGHAKWTQLGPSADYDPG